MSVQMPIGAESLDNLFPSSFSVDMNAMSVCLHSQSAVLSAVPAAYANVSAVVLKSNLPVIPGEWSSGEITSSFYDIVPEEPCVANLLGQVKASDFIAFDNSFFDVIGPTAKLEKIQSFPTDLNHVHEAPVWLAESNELLYSDTSVTEGYLYAIDIDTHAVRQVNFTPALSNVNGGTLGSDGRVYIVTNGGPTRGAYALNLTTGTVEPVVNNYRGRHFNSPNDLIFDSEGNMYFTDPTYGVDNGWEGVQPAELPMAVYRMDAKTKSLHAISVGVVTKPNGLALSPDELTLYVADSNSSSNALDSRRGVWAFDNPARSGPLTNPRMVHLVEGGWPDGLRTTTTGLLFAAVYGGVDIVDPASGFLLGRINTPGDIVFNVQAAKGKGAWLLTGRDHIYKATILAEGA